MSAGCGARTGLLSHEGDGSVDAGSDAEPQPDGAPGTCIVPDEQVTIEAENAPGYVFSLDRRSDGSYILGGGQGWSPNIEPGIYWLGGDDLDLRHVARTRRERIGVTVLPDVGFREGLLAAVSEEDNNVFFEMFNTNVPESPVLILSMHLCSQCISFWTRPLLGEEGILAVVVVEHFESDEVQAFLFPEELPEAFIESDRFPGSHPTLASGSEGFLVPHRRDGAFRVQHMRWSGELGESPPSGFSERVIMGPVATALDDDEVLIASLVDASGVSLLRALIADGYGNTLDAEDFEEEGLGLTFGMSLSTSRGTVALSWGESMGYERVGAHLLVLERASLNPIFGPALVSEPIRSVSSTYTPRTVLAPHPRGHALVWNAWHHETNYGIYGKIIRCF